MADKTKEKDRRNNLGKREFTQIVSLRVFSFVLTAILNSQAGCRCTLVPSLPLPVPRSPFPFPVPRSPIPDPRSPIPVTGISNIPRESRFFLSDCPAHLPKYGFFSAANVAERKHRVMKIVQEKYLSIRESGFRRE